ncbi:hypothetical protein [Phenylobacterium sp.]|uniref:hypothetical protein n=1 Tax=Phenylobacterium sp. TaxID=1871053 RepID=UPI002F93477E
MTATDLTEQLLRLASPAIAVLSLGLNAFLFAYGRTRRSTVERQALLRSALSAVVSQLEICPVGSFRPASREDLVLLQRRLADLDAVLVGACGVPPVVIAVVTRLLLDSSAALSLGREFDDFCEAAGSPAKTAYAAWDRRIEAEAVASRLSAAAADYAGDLRSYLHLLSR